MNASNLVNVPVDTQVKTVTINKHHFEAMKEVLLQFLGILDRLKDGCWVEKTDIENFESVDKIVDSLTNLFLPTDYERDLKEALEVLSDGE